MMQSQSTAMAGEPTATKNSRRFADLFLAIEQRIAGNAIPIDGVELWPRIRARLRKPFKEIAPLPAACVVPRAPPPPAASPAWRWLWRWCERARAPDSPPTPAISPARAPVPVRQPQPTRAEVEQRADAEVARLSALGPCDYLAFSRPNKSYQNLQGKRYAPILDPVFEDLRQRGRALTLCKCDRLEFDCVHPPITYDTAAQMELRRFLPLQDHAVVIR